MDSFVKVLEEALEARQGSGDWLESVKTIQTYSFLKPTFPAILVEPKSWEMLAAPSDGYIYRKMDAVVMVLCHIGTNDKVTTVASELDALVLKVIRALHQNLTLTTTTYAAGYTHKQRPLEIGNETYGMGVVEGSSCYAAEIPVSVPQIRRNGVITLT
ncbi:MAG: hypothetical protein P9M15_00895 [Candidatus Electryoneaceae bacterium]|nr:hypothetical protein [Candidatus Electryoneaceae bacterium]